MLALPIQRFCPFSTQESPSRRTVVSRAMESEPWSGSVSANAPMRSRVAIPGSHRWRCSSLPSRWIAPIASPDCTPRKVLTLPSPRDISRDTIPAASRESPGQP